MHRRCGRHQHGMHVGFPAGSLAWVSLCLAACNTPTVQHVTDPPTATIVTPEADAAVASGLVSFVGRASDDIEPPGWLLAVWSVAPDGGEGSVPVWQNACPAQAPDLDYVSRCETRLVAGAWLVRLTVTDRFGAQDQAVQTVVVQDVDVPTVTLVSVGTEVPGGLSDRLVADRPVAWAFAVEDADHPPSMLQVSWSSDVLGSLGALAPDADGEVRTSRQLPAGDHDITVVAIDPQGNRGELTQRVVIDPANVPPTCRLDAFGDVPVVDNAVRLAAGEVVAVSGVVLDPEGLWTGPDVTHGGADTAAEDAWQAASLWVTAAGASPTPVALTGPDELGRVQAQWTAPVGASTVELQGLDDVGTVCQATVLVTASAPPVVGWLMPTAGATLPLGSSVTLQIAATDDQTPAAGLTVQVASDVQGALGDAVLLDKTWQLTVPGLMAGAHVLTATAEDADGLTGEATRAVVVQP